MAEERTISLMSRLPFAFRTRPRTTLFCGGCAKPASHQQQTCVQLHIDSQGHQRAREMDTLAEQQRAERGSVALPSSVTEQTTTSATFAVCIYSIVMVRAGSWTCDALGPSFMGPEVVFPEG